jgi:nucleotidyltransferase/DNA polymerase involved in DNA repair
MKEACKQIILPRHMCPYTQVLTHMTQAVKNHSRSELEAFSISQAAIPFSKAHTKHQRRWNIL